MSDDTTSAIRVDETIKQIRAPAPPSTVRRLWIDTYLWWHDHVWIRAPVWLRHSWFSLSRWYYTQIVTRVWPRQRWLMRAVGREWRDLDSIIELTLFACIIHFVDQEKCFDVTVFTDENERMIREIYAYAKYGRKAYEVMIQHAYPTLKDALDFETDNPARDKCYAEVDRLETIMREKDDRYLRWVLDNRRLLWT